MADWIDREAAIKVLCDACGNAACPKGMIPRCSFYEKMRDIPTAPCWISVRDRLPDNGAEVLAWSESGFSYVDWWIDGKWKVNSILDGKYENVTHWMPLPEPPKPKEET